MTNQIEDPSIPSTSEKTPVIPSLTRQEYLDSSIQGKIRQELSRLRKQEAEVQKKIEQALEKENLDKASQSNKTPKGKSSILLKQELDDVRQKIETHHQRRIKFDKDAGVHEARSKLLQCYKSQPEQTLECWKEVQTFKVAVAKSESVSAACGSVVQVLTLCL